MVKKTAEEFAEAFPHSEIMENCCTDLACSACGCRDNFRVQFTGLCTVQDGGTDDIGDHNWESDSFCKCNECEEEGTVSDFNITGLDELLEKRKGNQ